MVILDLSIVNVALPSIQVGLHFSSADLQWVIDAYAIVFAGFLMLSGRAADVIGQRRTFLAALLVFSGASLVGGLAPNSTILIVARAVQGLGGAMMAACSLAIVTSTFAAGTRTPSGDRAVELDERRRRRDRRAAQRHDHAVGLVALDPADQRPDRRRHRARSRSVSSAERRSGEAASRSTCSARCVLTLGQVLIAYGCVQRRHRRLGHHGGVDPDHHRRGTARTVPGRREPTPSPARYRRSLLTTHLKLINLIVCCSAPRCSRCGTWARSTCSRCCRCSRSRPASRSCRWR